MYMDAWHLILDFLNSLIPTAAAAAGGGFQMKVPILIVAQQKPLVLYST